MRIAVVHSFYSSRQPSGENAVVDAQVAALRLAGHEVELVAARTDELEQGAAYGARAALTVATGVGASPIAQLAAFGPDVVHVHNLFPNWGTRWLRQWRGPLVATVHNFRPMCAAGTLYRDGHDCTECPDRSSARSVVHGCYRDSRVASIPLAIRTAGGVPGDPLLQRADAVVFPAERSRAIFERFGLRAENAVVVPNFVPEDEHSTLTAPGEAWAYVGRLTEEKGIRELVEHWPVGRRLDVFGSGPLEAELRALANPDIVFHGQVERSRVAVALKGARGLVFPSAWAEAAFPLVCIEAMAAGRAVVARAGSAAADALPGFGAGIVFDAWAGFAAALAQADVDAAALGAAGRVAYTSWFTPRSYVARIEKVYHAVLGRTSAA